MRTSHVPPEYPMEFEPAMILAKQQAHKFLADPMMLSWLNRRAGRHSPDVDCCRGARGKEAWEVYAESRGGTLRVELGEQYVFIFREGNIS